MNDPTSPSDGRNGAEAGVRGRRRSRRIGFALALLGLAGVPAVFAARAPGVRFRTVAADGVVRVQVVVRSPAPIGGYSIDAAFDPRALEIVATDGGRAPEFRAAPMVDVEPSGRLRIAAFQTSRLDGPKGRVHVATVLLRTTGVRGSKRLRLRAASVSDTTNRLVGTKGTIKCGDVTGDGKVTISDALAVAQFSVGLRPCASALAQPGACDINPAGAPDGRCNVGDALKMAQCSVGLVPCDFSCAGDFACAPVRSVLKGALPPTPGRFNYNLTVGLPGANAACNTNFAGTHACTYADLQRAQTAGDLAGLQDVAHGAVTSFWAIDPGQPVLQQCNDDAPGGSGRNWEYGTAHTASRGERVPLDNQAGTLGVVQQGVQCNISGTSWVGCCVTTS